MERIKNSDLPEGLIEAMRHVQGFINKSGMDKMLLELMRTRVSQINGCAYCLDMHSKLAIHAGETVQRLISVSAWREAPYYTAKERAVLEYAEVLTRLEEDSDIDAIHDELLKHFSKGDIAHLSLAIAQINSWNRLVKSTGIIPGSFQVTRD
jgi:AhpD family alkylhydroperoxidase